MLHFPQMPLRMMNPPPRCYRRRCRRRRRRRPHALSEIKMTADVGLHQSVVQLKMHEIAA